MNINLLTRLYPKTAIEVWTWIPKAEFRGWKLKNGNDVWYFSVQWLNSRLDIDNEQD